MSENAPAKERNGQPDEVMTDGPLIRAIGKAVDELKIVSKFMDRDLAEGREDIRDVRDRLARLETKVADLPSKVWIGVAVLSGMSGLSLLVTMVMKLVGK